VKVVGVEEYRGENEGLGIYMTYPKYVGTQDINRVSN
jgi:hypothetical protein